MILSPGVLCASALLYTSSKMKKKVISNYNAAERKSKMFVGFFFLEDTLILLFGGEFELRALSLSYTSSPIHFS
jgi:hypothetical protein